MYPQLEWFLEKTQPAPFIIANQKIYHIFSGSAEWPNLLEEHCRFGTTTQLTVSYLLRPHPRHFNLFSLRPKTFNQTKLILLLARFYIWLSRSKQTVPTVVKFSSFLEQSKKLLNPCPSERLLISISFPAVISPFPSDVHLFCSFVISALAETQHSSIISSFLLLTKIGM